MQRLHEREAGNPGSCLLTEELRPRVKTARRAAVDSSEREEQVSPPTTESEYLEFTWSNLALCSEQPSSDPT